MYIEDKRIIVFKIHKDTSYTIKFKDTESSKKSEIEINPENMNKIAYLFSKDRYAFVGYGNKYNDNIIINYVIKNAKIFINVNTQFITNLIDKTLNDILVEKNETLEKEYKYVNLFNSFDLQSFMFSKEQKVSLEQFVNASNYIYSDEAHDVDNIMNILNDNEMRINARLQIEDMYGVDLFDSHEGIVGVKLIKYLYLKRIRQKWSDIKDRHSYVKIIHLNDIILPEIQFENDKLNLFLENFKRKTILPSDNINEHVCFDNDCYEINLAGLRKNTNPIHLESDDEGDVYYIDIASFFPSILCAYNIKPGHIENEFIEEYNKILTTRLGFKYRDYEVSTAMKYMLNGIIGQFMIEDSWLYDPSASLKIRLNGALFMLMLVEQLKKHSDIQCVTIDGLFLKTFGDKKDEICNVVSEWESKTKLKAELSYFKEVYMISNNDYITSDFVYKGIFQKQMNTGRITSPNIIRLAAIYNLIHGQPVSSYIYQNRDISNFITSISSSDTSLKWKNRIFKNARIYYSTDEKICKLNDAGTKASSLATAKSGVTILDEIPDKLPENINYQYYISEANAIVEKIKQQQLSLF